MSLSITRRPGESFDLTWPDGSRRTVTVDSTDSSFTTILIDGKDPYMINQFSPRFVSVGFDTVELRASAIDSNRAVIIINAPREVQVLRDNTKCREAK